MRLQMMFSPPFNRSAVVASMTPMIDVTIPVGATIKLTIQPRQDDIADTPDSDNDKVTGVMIDGFADLTELTTFIDALPTAVNDNLVRMDFRKP